MPKVSVIIPCYNYARYLPDAVGSVADQTYRDFEVIIINDGSTDDTSDVARALIKKYAGFDIRLVEQDNAGLPGARNNGIRVSRGDYILPLDADDMLHPAYLETLVPLMDGDSSLGLAYSWSEKFGAERGVMEQGELTLRNLRVRNVNSCTALIRKSAWEEVGGYNPAMTHGGEDWEFSCSLYEAGYRGAVVAEVLFRYRRHGPSMIDNMVKNHAVESSREIKLLHPRIFEPSLSRVSLPLARAVIRFKARLRDPLTHYVYMKFPRLHGALARFKYDVLGFLWKG